MILFVLKCLLAYWLVTIALASFVFGIGFNPGDPEFWLQPYIFTVQVIRQLIGGNFSEVILYLGFYIVGFLLVCIIIYQRKSAKAAANSRLMPVAPPDLAEAGTATGTIDVSRIRSASGSTGFWLFLGTIAGAALASIFVFFASLSVVGLLAPILAVMTFFGILIFTAIATPITARKWAKPDSIGVGFTPLMREHALVQDVDAMCDRLGVPHVAHVGWYPSDQINAFAMGTSPQNFTMAFSRPLLELATRDEIRAIAGHELGHMLNNDMRTMQVGYSVQRTLTLLLVAYELRKFARVIFSTISEFALMRLSRQREFWADAVGAAVTSPQTMIAALDRLETHNSGVEPSKREKSIGMMMCHNRVSSFYTELFSTHPPTAKRIKALETGKFYRRLIREGGDASTP